MRNLRATWPFSNRHSSATHRRPKRMRFQPAEMLESRIHLTAAVEPLDGAGNNVANPTWGSTGTDLVRLTAAAYADGISSPSLASDPSARAISNILNSQSDPNNTSEDIGTVDQNSLSDFGYAFGQFMDHDLDNTPDGTTSDPIVVAAGDAIGPDSLPFDRSQTDSATGTSTSNPAQQITTVTSYFDLSQVYGSTQSVADALRTFNGGLLKTSAGNMLPYDNTTYFTQAQISALNMANSSQAVPENDLFAAGDVRANENIELTVLETLFVRNHNLIASQLQKEHSNWTDEQLYQEARKINIAQYQSIVYNEWIPAVLGQNALSKYTGYKANVNATISNEFSTVAYRFGHSLVSPTIAVEGNDGQSTEAAIPLSEDFFDPYILNPSGVTDPLTGETSVDIGTILKGEADGNGQAMDTMAVSPIRNLLFGNGVEGGEDLMALDVQRGRDHGIADYNTLRVDLGLPAITSFSQITSNVKVQKELEAAYPGGVNTIDAFEGGLAEDHLLGSDVGPLFQAIMVDQFTRLRDGDRFFYQNENFNSDESAFLRRGSTLAQVIQANTDVKNLQANVFKFQASISGTVIASNGQFRPRPRVGGITVDLEDTTGDLLATTVTDPRGNYTFNQLSTGNTNASITPGVSATGLYQVVLAPSTSISQTSATPQPVLVSAGDVHLNGVNFTVISTTAQPPMRPPGPPGRMGGAPAFNNPLNNGQMISISPINQNREPFAMDGDLAQLVN